VSTIQFETVSIGDVRVHVCSSEKFKTTALLAFIAQELKPEYVTKTALLPSVLQRGTASYPTTIELRRKLDSFYGATLFGDVFKRGERHLIQIGMEIANERYLSEKKSLLDEGINLFSEALFSPHLEQGGFKASYVEAEKKNLKQKIESLQDDKIRYASQRMVEEMCKGEPYALFNHGRIEDLPQIDAQNLYTYYQEVIQTCPIDIYCVGNVSADDVVKRLERNIGDSLRQRRKTLAVPSAVHSAARKEKTVIDRLNVKQGKLNLGCRTNVTIQDDDYPALMMYNGIFGGFPHSKLFLNVREKASLAYYCSSRLESHKGLLIIQSGIEISNFEKAVDIIKKQLAAMQQGDISDKELDQTKATLSNQLKEQQDRSFELIHFHFNQSVLSGRERTLEALLHDLEQVRKEDITRVAEKIQLETIYFLRDQEGNANAKN
jgi:predicted Zn-dependent peptidase